MSRANVPADVAAIRAEISKVLCQKDKLGRVVGDAQMGVYAFYDYDGEPIYVGQTVEKLRVRIRRHLTNHRTDAVAMNVLDPFEVAEIRMWPFYGLARTKAKGVLDAAEFTVYHMAVAKSRHKAVLNEKGIPHARSIKLPPCVSGKIIPEDIYAFRKHADIRIARRASTIAALARVISERSVSRGLRKTLHVQAMRLEHLVRTRYEETAGAEDTEADDD